MSSFPISTAGSIDLAALAKALQPYLTGTPPVVTPPPVIPPGASTVYADGVMGWAGDYSYPSPPITIDYKDTSGAPKTGTYCIKVDPHGAQWGAWQPYANTAQSWDTTPYTSLNFDLKPTDAASVYQVQFLLAGDKPTGISVPLAKYGPKPQPGIWASYSIPLSDLGVAKTHIYKFACQDIGSNNPWFIGNVRFQ